METFEKDCPCLLRQVDTVLLQATGCAWPDDAMSSGAK